MFCTYCEQYKHLAGPNPSFVEGTAAFRIACLRAHWKSKDHKKCQQQYRRHQEGIMEKGPMDDVMQKLGEENKQVPVKLFTTVYYILKEETIFSMLPSLIRLQKKNGSSLLRLISYTSFIHQKARITTLRLNLPQIILLRILEV